MGSGAMSGVVTRQYKAGSIVYFEGDKSENIFVLKSGKVVLTYIRPETGEEIKEDIKSGEFFGVKSALGKYPREETAQTLTDAVVLQLRLDDFERIVLSNVQVVKKMLRVFSNQLRRIGRAVREVLGETSVQNPEAELFKIAEYYFRNGRAEQALYAYKKYLEYYPNTQFSQLCMQRVKDIQSGNFTAAPDGDVPSALAPPPSSDFGGSDIPEHQESLAAHDGPSDMVDFEFDDAPSSHGSGPGSDLSTEMDSFISGGSDFSFGSDPVKTLASRVNDANSLFADGKIPEALSEFTSIRNEMEPSDSADRNAWEEAHFRSVTCQYAAGNIKDAFAEISSFMKQFPQSKWMKNLLLYAGYVFEKSGAKDKAVPYYKKIAATPPKDDITAQAMQRLKALGAV